MNLHLSLRGAWLAAALAVPLALPLVASADPAFTRGSVNLRAGPSTDYPAVVRLRPGQSLEVVGCTSGYGWCDVVLPDGLRGWVSAGLLDYPWGGSPVPLAQYGAMIGVPIIAFSLGRYWNDHYRDRPFYREPRWWGQRPPPPPVAGWRPLPPPPVAWQPRPPRPDWRPPPSPQRPPGWQGRPNPPPPGWNQRPDRPPGWERPDRPHRADRPDRPPNWQRPPDRPRPPNWNDAPRPPRPDGPRPRPPGAENRPHPNGSGPPRGGLPPGLPRGTVAPTPNIPLGDRP